MRAYPTLNGLCCPSLLRKSHPILCAKNLCKDGVKAWEEQSQIEFLLQSSWWSFLCWVSLPFYYFAFYFQLLNLLQKQLLKQRFSILLLLPREWRGQRSAIFYRATIIDSLSMHSVQSSTSLFLMYPTSLKVLFLMDKRYHHLKCQYNWILPWNRFIFCLQKKSWSEWLQLLHGIAFQVIL